MRIGGGAGPSGGVIQDGWGFPLLNHAHRELHKSSHPKAVCLVHLGGAGGPRGGPPVRPGLRLLLPPGLPAGGRGHDRPEARPGQRRGGNSGSGALADPEDLPGGGRQEYRDHLMGAQVLGDDPSGRADALLEKPLPDA